MAIIRWTLYMDLVLTGLLGGFTLLTGSNISMAHGHTHHYAFVLRESNFTRLCSTKSMLVVNESFPGPVLHVHKGDTVYVNVHNEGDYGVSIHWHGVKQPRNPWYDGPEKITQCSIPPRTNFTQKIIFTDEEGTLWWHAHSDWSRATVHGAIVISPAKGTLYPFPKPHAEEVIILGSWFKGDVMAIIEDALITGGEPNLSDAHTINGQPGDLYNCSSDSTYRLLVEYGKTYLLRIINAVMNEEMFFGIAKHNLTVVGSDAAYIKPITVDYIMITPGKTMDVLFTANQTPGRYYMAGSPYADTEAPFDNSTTTGIVQYRRYNKSASSPLFPSLPAYNDSEAALNFTAMLLSLASCDHPINVPMKVTTSMFITIAVNLIDNCNGTCDGPDGDRLAASMTNISFQMPSIDILEAYYQMQTNVYTTDFPDEPLYYFNFTGDVGNNTQQPSLGTKVKVLDYNESVEIVFQGTNLGPENHPIHLHGYSFYVLGFGLGNFNSTTDPESYNLVDPPYVNTIGVPKNGWATIRFFADNPGVWHMHCHLDRHASWGMSNAFIVKNGTTEATSILPRPSYMPPCASSKFLPLLESY